MITSREAPAWMPWMAAALHISKATVHHTLEVLQPPKAGMRREEARSMPILLMEVVVGTSDQRMRKSGDYGPTKRPSWFCGLEEKAAARLSFISLLSGSMFGEHAQTLLDYCEKAKKSVT